MRVLAAQRVNEVLYAGAARVLDGVQRVTVIKPPGEAWKQTVVQALRADLDELVPHHHLSDQEQRALAMRSQTLNVTAIAVTAAGGPAKWASLETGRLLGHGSRWYHNSIERPARVKAKGGSPWPALRRRKFAARQKLESEAARHPWTADRFTAEERLFGRLPATAQTAIGTAVRKVLSEEMLQLEAALKSGRRAGRATFEREFPLVDYYTRPLSYRRDRATLPSVLKDVVRTAISALPPNIRQVVSAKCRRGTRLPKVVLFDAKARRQLGLAAEGARGRGPSGTRWVTPVPPLSP